MLARTELAVQQGIGGDQKKGVCRFNGELRLQLEGEGGHNGSCVGAADGGLLGGRGAADVLVDVVTAAESVRALRDGAESAEAPAGERLLPGDEVGVAIVRVQQHPAWVALSPQPQCHPLRHLLLRRKSRPWHSMRRSGIPW
ncbi:hypothetical protein GOP47_0002521 [Adiantum capillus-veneris]|uniref:Uncharacterized protein n=1 Tax=Adiantum capillus-veneris TaxID=13818 RepID=A0A9D4ZP68_ADICA|nr:hypothetical protein GOP47_0002521 [Adiantum capillus-veneris]